MSCYTREQQDRTKQDTPRKHDDYCTKRVPAVLNSLPAYLGMLYVSCMNIIHVLYTSIHLHLHIWFLLEEATWLLPFLALHAPAPASGAAPAAASPWASPKPQVRGKALQQILCLYGCLKTGVCCGFAHPPLLHTFVTGPLLQTLVAGLCVEYCGLQ